MKAIFTTLLLALLFSSCMDDANRPIIFKQKNPSAIVTQADGKPASNYFTYKVQGATNDNGWFKQLIEIKNTSGKLLSYVAFNTEIKQGATFRHVELKNASDIPAGESRVIEVAISPRDLPTGKFDYTTKLTDWTVK